MIISAIVVDDEPLSIDIILQFLTKVPFIKVLASFTNVLEAAEFMKSSDVDLIFVDIEMPDISGVELIQKLTFDPMVIFITAHPGYAVEGFELSAVDYLLKPFGFNRFLEACFKAQKLFLMHKNEVLGKDIELESDKFLFVKSEYNLVKININSISIIEGLKDYIRIYSTDFDQPILTLQSLKTIEDFLPSSIFYRVHKSYIINLHYIESLQRTSILVKKREIPLGAKYKDIILKRIEGKIL